MPDQNNPAAQPDPAAASGEFEFDLPATENPRLKRRSLKVKSTQPLTPVNSPPASARELEHEAPPVSAKEARPEHQPQARDDDDAEINAAVKFTEPSSPAVKAAAPSATKSTSYIPRTASTTAPASSPHGTRPSTLYYTTGQRKDQETSPPMKTTPTASPSPASSATASSSPVRSATASGTGTRPATVVDYKTNIERQAREQKSIGGVLAIVVYVLIGFFVLGASLAGYGLYAISIQLKQQSLTISQLDQRYSEQHQELATQLNTTIDTLTKAQAQIGREQELILQQQEAINKLITANDATATALRQERQVRASETSSLRARVNNLEDREQSR